MVMTNITMTPYNILNLTNSTSLGSLMKNITPLMGGYYLGIAFLVIIFAVSFLYLKGLGRFWTRSCVMGSLSLTMISALFLFSMGLINVGILWFIIFVWIGTLFFIALFMD